MDNVAPEIEHSRDSKFGLTPKQGEALRWISQYMRDTGGISPTFEEVREGLNLASRSNVAALIDRLVERGFLRRIPNATRSLSIVE